MAVDIGKKQTYKNIILNIAAFMLQFGISFYSSPIIVAKVGKSAYGFIGLANDFVAYAGIIASVFNSVAARFIATSYYQKKYREANSYFSSLVLCNLVLALILSFIGTIVVWNVNAILDVPADLLVDVQWTFTLVFASYLLTLATVVLTTATYVTNRTDISGSREIIKQLLRLLFILFFLNYISVKIYWVAAATLIATAILAVLNVPLTKRLTPELSITIKNADWKYAKILAMSGGWMAFTNISNLLIRGLDLTIANALINADAMGLLSIARTIPNNVTSAINTIAPIFTPIFIVFYAKNDIEGLVTSVNKSIKTIASMLFVPICGFLVYSKDFYSLWQKGLNEEEILIVTILSSITLLQAFFNSTTSTLAQLSLVVNKLKLPVLVSFACGVLNIIVVVILLNFTDLGIYAIVISSTIIMILRYVLFNSYYAAKVLKINISVFLKEEVKVWITIPILLILFEGIRRIVPVTSWISLVISAFIAGVLGYIVIMVLLSRSAVLGKLKNFKK